MPSTGAAQRIVIAGAGGHGREVLDVLEDMATAGADVSVVGFVDDAPAHPERITARGAVLLEGFGDVRAEGAHYVVGVAGAAGRRALVARAEAAGLRAASLRHPSVVSGSSNIVGEGLIAFPLASYTTNITFGRHVHLSRCSTVGHDCVFGDFVTVLPGANVSGDVRLGDDVWVGTGATILQGVSVGSGTTVGAGAVVTRDLPPDVVAFGVPAKPVRRV
ncbi:MAG: NeuD/PglB/VioB family sugar acetyltransferase [Acidimicrobiales bacterium]|nr:NeuD/PglB/VioB family sugar acetyltransferase [Acidimicrobiales bacterium]